MFLKNIVENLQLYSVEFNEVKYNKKKWKHYHFRGVGFSYQLKFYQPKQSCHPPLALPCHQATMSPGGRKPPKIPGQQCGGEEPLWRHQALPGCWTTKGKDLLLLRLMLHYVAWMARWSWSVAGHIYPWLTGHLKILRVSLPTLLKANSNPFRSSQYSLCEGKSW